MNDFNHMENKELTIYDLLANGKYIIPFYQRNYAWGEAEVNQLLQDIWDSSKEEEGTYYLGTLVVSKTPNEQYEIVDGQQRHTTLSIIHAVLQQKTKEPQKKIKCNLFFAARTENEKLLCAMYEGKDSVSIQNLGGSSSFLTAMQTVKQFLEKKGEKQLPQFCDTFYNQVGIFRVLLPEGTDLNHYFEIMNNRGEQLEKHEILKAKMMESMEDEDKRRLFAKIWDACSNMNSYVQMNFRSSDRVVLFGENLREIPGLEKLKTIVLENDSVDNEEATMKYILEEHALPTDFIQENEQEIKEKYRSIIDFPNFLLQVRKIQKADDSISLDDKKLLDNFGYPADLPDAFEFIQLLLNYRILFDKYVIKRAVDHEDWNWKIQEIERSKEKNIITYKNTISNDEERHKLIMQQAMFQVTFSGNNYKNWLFEYLKTLKHRGEIEGTVLLATMKSLMKANVPTNIEEVLGLGLGTPRFLFNYTDYLLWELYYDNVRGEGEKDNINQEKHQSLLEKIAKVKEKFNSFRFVQRSSVEHLFPQSRLHELKGEAKQVTMDCFGNLCLISRSSNSTFSNHLPYQKKVDSAKWKRNESLKQLIMFQCFDTEWNTEEIETHQKEIKELLTQNNINSDG